jgi:cation diffusion facilitator CzcD-associated flavoprotein CzcO
MFHPGTPAALEQTKVCLDHLAEKVKDPKLRELLTPNYPMWARRTLYTNDFYPTLALPHVELVAEKILRIEADGIVSSTAQAKMVHNAGVGYSVEEPIDAAAPTKKREIDVIICELRQGTE